MSEDEEEEIIQEKSLNLTSLKLAYKLINKSDTQFNFNIRHQLDPHRYIFLCVTDDGEGILPEDQSKLFKLFGKIDKVSNKNNKG